MKFLAIVFLMLPLLGIAEVKGPGADYKVVDIPVPEGVVVEAGGVCHWPDGTLVVATRRGDVWTVLDGKWNQFATGLMGPMGIWADTVGEVYVTQWPELTRIKDLDGDLAADRYETVTAGWDMPGARTDFVYGLSRDKKGNFYGSMHTTHKPWKQGREVGKKGNSKYNFGGPMGAPVKGRGWSFQVDPKGKLTWWSSGLRAPNGLGFNAEGDLFATDNQGDWVGTSALHHIEQGDFHGHPSSYHWDSKRTVDMNIPLDQLATKLDKIRKRPVVLFPHGILGNSPSEPVLAPADGSFGPFAGQFFVGDNVAPLISRVYLEKIGGEYQGVCFPFLRGRGLQKALCRMDFSPKGELVVEFGCRGWGPATTGLQKVSWSGTTPFEMQSINLLEDGFRITFTKPLAKQDLAKAFSIKSYRYKYHHLYGSPQVDVEPLTVRMIDVSEDRRTVTLRTDQLKAGKIYAFNLKDVTASDGSMLWNSDAYYTLNKLRSESANAARARWKLFPFCMSHSDTAKRSLDDQATLFRELGYPGCGHLCQEFGYKGFGHPKDVTVIDRAASLEKQGLRLNVAYARMQLDADQPIDMEKLKAAMPTLGKHNSILGVLLLGDRKKDLDGKAVALLNRIADLAKPHGVEIAIYPHTGDYTQTVGQSLRVVRKVNRPKQVGVMFNLYHWMNVEKNRELKTVLTEARPWLKLVNINGSPKDKAQVLPLGQGDFNIKSLLGILSDIDYCGSIGLMCWGIRGDARKHLTTSMTQWGKLKSPARLKLRENTCEFETENLKGRVGGNRFIGLNQVVHKPSRMKLAGGNGLLTVYRVFTRNHRYGSAAYSWKERKILIESDSILMRWSATAQRPFDLEARYSFPKSNLVKLEVTVTAKKILTDFEVQIGTYFDKGFPAAGVLMGDGKFVSSPAKLGTWHAFPRDQGAKAIIGDGRWSHGPSPVKFVIRPPFASPVSIRRHTSAKLLATLKSTPTDCFAIYTAHDKEPHYSNYNALFGRTIAKGETATAVVTMAITE